MLSPDPIALSAPSLVSRALEELRSKVNPKVERRERGSPSDYVARKLLPSIRLAMKQHHWVCTEHSACVTGVNSPGFWSIGRIYKVQKVQLIQGAHFIIEICGSYAVIGTLIDPY